MVFTIENDATTSLGNQNGLVAGGAYGNARRIGHDIDAAWLSMLSLVDLGSGLWHWAHNDTGGGGWWNDLGGWQWPCVPALLDYVDPLCLSFSLSGQKALCRHLQQPADALRRHDRDRTRRFRTDQSAQPEHGSDTHDILVHLQGGHAARE